MKVTEIIRGHSVHKPPREIDVPFPKTLDDMVKVFGVDKIYNWACDEAKRDIRKAIYRSHRKTDEELMDMIYQELGVKL